jgi:LysM repeat protein
MKKRLVFGLLITALSIFVVVGCVEPPPPPETPPPEVPPGLILDGAVNHTVVSGDTLYDLAASNYGGDNAWFFPLIRAANDKEVPNADVIEVGTNLVIPNLQRNLNSPPANGIIRVESLRIADQYEREGKPNAAIELRNLATRISK